jgi:hypothetical protein
MNKKTSNFLQGTLKQNLDKITESYHQRNGIVTGTGFKGGKVNEGPGGFVTGDRNFEFQDLMDAMRECGYDDDIEYFFNDNPGAVEAIFTWMEANFN